MCVCVWLRRCVAGGIFSLHLYLWLEDLYFSFPERLTTSFFPIYVTIHSLPAATSGSFFFLLLLLYTSQALDG